jgi:hypothetical protein
MHASSLIAILAATAVSASPMMARDTTSAFAPAPTGNSTILGGFHSGAPSGPAAPSKPAGSAPSGSQPAAPAQTSILGNPNATPNLATPAGLVAELLTEDTVVNRFKEIKKDIDAGTISLVFDHNPAANPNVTKTAGAGGQVDLANRANFPVLTGLGISSASIFFQPCGLNTPHIHPRATEYFTVATKNNITTGFVLENGETDEFTAELGIWQGTVFPVGSIHWQQNNDCTPAVAVAGLNSEDPGASSIAQNFLRFTNPAVVNAALGPVPAEVNGQNFRDNKALLPASLAKGVEECLIRCNIKY